MALSPRAERALAALCYLGALRVPVVSWFLPGLALTLPSGLIFTGIAWLYGRRRSPFLLHHAREGLKWSVQANLLAAMVSLLSMAFHFAWEQTGIHLLSQLWHWCAVGLRWLGGLVSVLTLYSMFKAARGSTADAFTTVR